jgi:PPOX class probable F420-dependent enzyme
MHVASMNEHEIWVFLSEGTRTAHVATVRADGRPHVKPVWFVVEGPPESFRLLFTTGAETVKGRTLLRDHRIAVSVDDPTPPYSFVIVEGTATLSKDMDQLREAATRIGARYMGEDRAEEFGTRNAVPGELLVELTPTRVIAERDVSGY